MWGRSAIKCRMWMNWIGKKWLVGKERIGFLSSDTDQKSAFRNCCTYDMIWYLVVQQHKREPYLVAKLGWVGSLLCGRENPICSKLNYTALYCCSEAWEVGGLVSHSGNPTDRDCHFLHICERPLGKPSDTNTDVYFTYWGKVCTVFRDNTANTFSPNHVKSLLKSYINTHK